MSTLWLALARRLDEYQIQYCLLREEAAAGGRGDLDLLVARAHSARLATLLAELGFVRLPAWGYAPHQLYLTYDADADAWLKLDVMTEATFGRGVAALRTDLAGSCLARRRRSGAAWVPAVEDELILLLLHCVLDKGRFDPARRQRLLALRREVTDTGRLSAWLDAYWSPTQTWADVAALLDQENWAALLEQGPAVAARLRGGPAGSAAVTARRLWASLLRVASRAAGLLRPPGLSVALLAPDGAGKSTLAAGLHRTFFLPVHVAYLGLYPKRAGGPRRQARWLGPVRRQWRLWSTYLAARARLARGHLVLFDRYPYDAWLAPQRRLRVWQRARRWLEAHACPPPDLVLLLDAPGELLFARKGEHSAGALEQQRQAYLRLQSRLPRLVVVDATASAEVVRRQALRMIWQWHAAHLRGEPIGRLDAQSPPHGGLAAAETILEEAGRQA